jgi:hypothetical protein
MKGHASGFFLGNCLQCLQRLFVLLLFGKTQPDGKCRSLPVPTEGSLIAKVALGFTKPATHTHMLTEKMHVLECQSRGGAITEYCSTLAGSSALAARRGSINAEEIPLGIAL